MQERPFVRFVAYNNAVPIAISIVLLGAGGAFAATDPGAIYSAAQSVVSIDNSYLVNKNLSLYSPRVEITGVTEDTDNYYVAYNFYTIDLKDSIWQDVTKQLVMSVSKADLSSSADRDLGLYVTGQLRQVTDHELAYLKDVQGIEQKNPSHKVVATQYGGLVGKFLDTSTQELPGYSPVIAPAPSPTIATAIEPTPGQQNTNPNPQSSPPPTGNPSLSLQILGNNPAQIPRGSSYNDLGAIAMDAQNDTIRIETYLDGAPVQQITIDTSATSTHTVRYVALDPQNNSVSAQRTIIVYDPAIGPTPSQSATSSPSTAPTSDSSDTQSAPSTQQEGGSSTADSTSTPATSSGTTTSSQASSSSASTSTPTDSSSSATSTELTVTQNEDQTQTATSTASSTPPASNATMTPDSGTAATSSQSTDSESEVGTSTATTTGQ